MSKNRIQRIILMVCITLSSILFLVNIYAIMNTMVSLKYTPSQDLEIVMNTSIWFNTYVFINIVVMIFLNRLNGKE